MKTKIMLAAGCDTCGKTERVEVDGDKFSKYLNGDHDVQVVFPDLSPQQRELVMAHRPRPFSFYMCPACWDDMAGDE